MIDLLAIGLIVWAAWAWRDHATSSPRATSVPPGQEGNPEAIAFILHSMQERGVTLEQLARAQPMPGTAAPAKPKRQAGDIAMKVFTYLGGIFILGGVGAYIAMFWPEMSSFMRIFITLGLGIALSIFSCIVMKEGKYPQLALPLIVIAAIVETGGWCVFVEEMFPHGHDVRKAAAFIFGVMALQQWATYGMFRRTALFFFATLFSYGFLDSGLDLLGMREEFIWMLLGGSLLCVSDWLRKSPHSRIADIGFILGGFWFNIGLYDYIGDIAAWPEAAMAAGISMCALGYGIRQIAMQRISSLYFLLGSATFYAGLFDRVAHKPYELVYLAFAIGMMYGHILLESGAILFTSTLAILGFIGYYTDEHFVNSVGWPVALILLGMAFFAVGAMALRIRRRSK